MKKQPTLHDDHNTNAAPIADKPAIASTFKLSLHVDLKQITVTIQSDHQSPNQPSPSLRID